MKPVWKTILIKNPIKIQTSLPCSEAQPVPNSDDGFQRYSLKTISLLISSNTHHFHGVPYNSHEWIYYTMNSNLLFVSMTSPAIYKKKIYF